MSPTERMMEDIAILKTEVIHLRRDMSKLLSILVESDKSIVGRTGILETKIEQLEKENREHESYASNVKLALISLSGGVIITIVGTIIELIKSGVLGK